MHILKHIFLSCASHKWAGCLKNAKQSRQLGEYNSAIKNGKCSAINLGDENSINCTLFSLCRWERESELYKNSNPTHLRNVVHIRDQYYPFCDLRHSWRRIGICLVSKNVTINNIPGRTFDWMRTDLSIGFRQ